jgi:hypothetical protein
LTRLRAGRQFAGVQAFGRILQTPALEEDGFEPLVPQREETERIKSRSTSANPPRAAIISGAVMVVGAPAPTSLPVFGGRA